ncbi:acetylornithine deacetylase/succinyl-diaminopimelate desuccinylase-like protein [Saonia flava]|uniref:Acetylornithine deacetylase/succinyl-diaminopimelate desuccinylase-like protein n=1 Tax=Saonia flava TaxID=523696 RepID=A0A846QVT7_9FLAO|nr:M20/M25/M40 family metallo-hydrolase [Saonia flava]NJB70682.1 acetylornithine deacetylase/succinyl-diaminopimelate desuccinylase-like protein [Saonia flava]
MRKLLSLLIISCSTFSFAQDATQLKSQIRHTIDELRDFVLIPNDALEHADINRNLTWLTQKFNARGFNTSVLPTEGESIFFAALPIEDNKPTILFYMHFDGQSVDPNKWDQSNPYKVELKTLAGDEWKTLPFSDLDTDINYDWRLFGRSTSDDKGPIVMFLNAIDLLKKNNKTIPFNIKVILDSEEEKSSKPLPKAVKEYRELLEADFLVINDGPVHVSGKPTIVYGCRGITTLSLTTYGPVKPQHSGHYGNYAPNPGFQLAQVLATMKDVDGKVLIPGYYDGITLDENTLSILKSVPDNEGTIKNTLQIRTSEKVGSFYQESLQYPSLNIRGLGSGWIGKQARTIVPESATAEIDIRLVPETNGTRLKDLVKKHIVSQGFHITDSNPSKSERLAHDKLITITEGSVTDAFRTDLNNPHGQFLVEILKNTFEDDVVQIRIMGGTVPISPFINELKIPAFIVPMVNPDNNQHSPNENLKIGQIAYGIKTFYGILSSEE